MFCREIIGFSPIPRIPFASKIAAPLPRRQRPNGRRRDTERNDFTIVFSALFVNIYLEFYNKIEKNLLSP